MRWEKNDPRGRQWNRRKWAQWLLRELGCARPVGRPRKA
jgi:hypothetical protein